jgi:hypothetical protein
MIRAATTSRRSGLPTLEQMHSAPELDRLAEAAARRGLGGAALALERIRAGRPEALSNTEVNALLRVAEGEGLTAAMEWLRSEAPLRPTTRERLAALLESHLADTVPLRAAKPVRAAFQSRVRHG